jgi:hypothetical protein
MSFAVNAQVEDRTIGLRTSAGNYGIGPEISYQHGLNEINRIELGLGIGMDENFNRFGLGASYHWVGAVENGFSWFAGPAVQGWVYSFDTGIHKNKLINNGSGVGASIGAQFGVEYNFNKDLNLPFTASLDSKPMFNFVNYYSGFEFAIGLSIRYSF